MFMRFTNYRICSALGELRPEYNFPIGAISKTSQQSLKRSLICILLYYSTTLHNII